MKQQIVTAALLLTALGGGFLACALHPAQAWSLSERRHLAQLPAVSLQTLSDGTFAEKFDAAAPDQFPLRDVLRGIKAEVQYRILRQRDNNGVYLADGSLSRIESALNEDSVRAAGEKLNAVRDRYFPDSRVFYGVIPDKNYYLAAQNGYPHLDYDRLNTLLQETVTGMEKIDLYDCLGAEDYYRTDSHWRQECLETAAARIAGRLGVEITPMEDYTETRFSEFRGVYWGQSALPLAAETLTYLEDDVLKQCTVTHYETGQETGVYQPELLSGRDPYDVFLGGADALLTITNPNAQTDRELILFRDSFGSSLAPLLVRDYQTVTLVDLRYISSKILDQFLDFHGQDVLFLYSPSVYNNAAMLK